MLVSHLLKKYFGLGWPSLVLVIVSVTSLFHRIDSLKYLKSTTHAIVSVVVNISIYWKRRFKDSLLWLDNEISIGSE